MPTIFWAGDSTVQYNDATTYPQTGLGQVLHLYLKPDVTVRNYARNGRSTKSFIDESRMIPIYDNISAGDFLFVQFGHNDEKIADASRYSEAMTDYKVNLTKFVNVARNKGAYPVLITPLERRAFDEDGNQKPTTHGIYPQAVIELGKELGVAVIDLTSRSHALIDEAGMEETKDWFMNLEPGKYPVCPEGKSDNTHLKYHGAFKFAGCIADGLAELGGVYAELLGNAGYEEEVFSGGVM